MAIFSNQATLTYNGNTTNSNIAYGEILDVLTTSKTSIEGIYTQNGLVTYVVTLRNTGNAALNGLTVTDNLGGYAFGSTTLYPLTYSDDSVALFIDGVLQPTPAVVPGPPLVISGINIPGGSVGLSKDSVILLEQIRTIDKKRLREHMGHLDENQMMMVDDAIAVSFGLGGRLT